MCVCVRKRQQSEREKEKQHTTELNPNPNPNPNPICSVMDCESFATFICVMVCGYRCLADPKSTGIALLSGLSG
jgi:hypothetical protein